MYSKITFDYRESQLYSSFQKIFPNILILTTNLDVGDIIIEKNNYPLKIIIERKTISDLNSSIKDGRYKEQKIRLKTAANNNNVKICYLLEGVIPYNDKFISKNTILGFYHNTMIRDNIIIFRSISIEESCEIIKHIFDKLEKNEEIFLGGQIKEESMDNLRNEEIEYANTLKLKKKENITGNIFFMETLALIPGISINISSIIVNKYRTLMNLIETYGKIENEDDRMRLLRDLEMKVSNGEKVRKIGIKNSEKIYKFIKGII
jgi:crossover junction endonuclease MUS81